MTDRIYATKQEATEAAISWVRADSPGNLKLCRSVPSTMVRTNQGPHIGACTAIYDTDFKGKQSAGESYALIQGGETVLGWLLVCEDNDGLDGNVYARKTPTKEEKTFSWRDPDEYIRQRDTKKAKAFSDRQAERNGIGPSQQPNLFSKMLAVWRRVVQRIES